MWLKEDSKAKLNISMPKKPLQLRVRPVSESISLKRRPTAWPSMATVHPFRNVLHYASDKPQPL